MTNKRTKQMIGIIIAMFNLSNLILITMKTLKLALFSVICVLFLSPVYAGGEKQIATSESYNTMFYNEISSQLYFPAQAKDQFLSGFVVVSFTITEEGNISVLEMNGSSPVFMEAAQKSLSEIALCSHAAGKIYHMQFNYSLF